MLLTLLLIMSLYTFILFVNVGNIILIMKAAFNYLKTLNNYFIFQLRFDCLVIHQTFTGC